MGKFIFITGGSRSGKSSFAVKMASAIRLKKIFVATCVPKDREMKERVRLHRLHRPSSWETIEGREDLASLFELRTKESTVIILDCLTLFVSRMLMREVEEEEIKLQVRRIAGAARKGRSTVIVVSNEVGCGLVPASKLGRDFRDIAGSCNQIVAGCADEVIYMVSGIPLKIKGE